MKKEYVINFIGLLLLFGALAGIYLPQIAIFHWWSHHIMQITVAYWILGILFLIIRLPRLTMFAFAASGMLSLYLRSISNTALVPPPLTKDPVLRLGHFNLSAATDILPTISKILSNGADVISLQEISPEWVRPIKDSLSKYYPHQCLLLGTDIYSFGLLSKYPFAHCDTMYCGQAPNLVVRLRNQVSQKSILLIASYIEPALFGMARQQQEKHLDSLAKFIADKNLPTITLGNYNNIGNSPEILNMRKIAHLNESRRGFRPLRDDGHISIFEVPTDYIFYSNDFQCVDFQSLSGANSERIGIMGAYQFLR